MVTYGANRRMAQTQVMTMTAPSRLEGWQEGAHQLWQQGQRQGAIDQVLKLINASAPAVPKTLGMQLIYYVFYWGIWPALKTSSGTCVRFIPMTRRFSKSWL